VEQWGSSANIGKFRGCVCLALLSLYAECGMSISEIFDFKLIFSAATDVLSVFAMILSFFCLVCLYGIMKKIKRKK